MAASSKPRRFHGRGWLGGAPTRPTDEGGRLIVAAALAIPRDGGAEPEWFAMVATGAAAFRLARMRALDWVLVIGDVLPPTEPEGFQRFAPEWLEKVATTDGPTAPPGAA